MDERAGSRGVSAEALYSPQQQEQVGARITQGLGTFEVVDGRADQALLAAEDQQGVVVVEAGGLGLLLQRRGKGVDSAVDVAVARQQCRQILDRRQQAVIERDGLSVDIDGGGVVLDAFEGHSEMEEYVGTPWC